MFELQTSFIDTASNWGRSQKQSTLKAYLPCYGYGKGVIFFLFLFFFLLGLVSHVKIVACSVHYSVKH